MAKEEKESHLDYWTFIQVTLQAVECKLKPVPVRSCLSEIKGTEYPLAEGIVVVRMVLPDGVTTLMARSH